MFHQHGSQSDGTDHTQMALSMCHCYRSQLVRHWHWPGLDSVFYVPPTWRTNQAALTLTTTTISISINSIGLLKCNKSRVLYRKDYTLHPKLLLFIITPAIDLLSVPSVTASLFPSAIISNDSQYLLSNPTYNSPLWPIHLLHIVLQLPILCPSWVTLISLI